jgi:hypothetical protein
MEAYRMAKHSDDLCFSNRHVSCVETKIPPCLTHSHDFILHIHDFISGPEPVNRKYNFELIRTFQRTTKSKVVIPYTLFLDKSL